MTLADFYIFYSFALANGIAQKLFDIDLLADHADIAALNNRLAEHPSIAQVEAEKVA
jgi:glutathione S-transferase